jgi:hypothetical protein
LAVFEDVKAHREDALVVLEAAIGHWAYQNDLYQVAEQDLRPSLTPQVGKSLVEEALGLGVYRQKYLLAYMVERQAVSPQQAFEISVTAAFGRHSPAVIQAQAVVRPFSWSSGWYALVVQPS